MKQNAVNKDFSKSLCGVPILSFLYQLHYVKQKLIYLIMSTIIHYSSGQEAYHKKNNI